MTHPFQKRHSLDDSDKFVFQVNFLLDRVFLKSLFQVRTRKRDFEMFRANCLIHFLSFIVESRYLRAALRRIFTQEAQERF